MADTPQTPKTVRVRETRPSFTGGFHPLESRVYETTADQVPAGPDHEVVDDKTPLSEWGPVNVSAAGEPMASPGVGEPAAQTTSTGGSS
jgi:hypothetical protein